MFPKDKHLNCLLNLELNAVDNIHLEGFIIGRSHFSTKIL